MYKEFKPETPETLKNGVEEKREALKRNLEKVKELISQKNFGGKREEGTDFTDKKAHNFAVLRFNRRDNN